VVLLVADAVISSFGLRVRKPLRRRELRAISVGVGASDPAAPSEEGPAEG